MATKQAASITSFFPPVPKCRAQEECSVSAENNTDDSVAQDTSLFCPETEVTTPEDTDRQSTVDIAYFVTASSLTVHNQVKYRIIKERKPPLNIAKHTRTARGRVEPTKGAVTTSGLKFSDFLAYSRSTQGLFCLACVLFPTSGAHEGASRAQYLVTKPYQNWKDGKADLMAHAHLHYHQGARPGSALLYRPWKTLVFELTWQLLTKARSL